MFDLARLRVFAVLIATVSVLGLSACGGDDSDDSSESDESTTEASTPVTPTEPAGPDPAVAEMQSNLENAGFKVSGAQKGSGQPHPLGALDVVLPSKANVTIYVYASPAEAQAGGKELVTLAENPKFDPVTETTIEGANVYSGTICCVEDGAVLDDAEFQSVVVAGEGQ